MMHKILRDTLSDNESSLPAGAAFASAPLSGHAIPTLTENSPDQLNPRRLRIVVVDDNRDAADLLGVLLQLEGHEIAIAYDGEAALEAVSQHLPHVVLLDIGLPQLNGYEVCRWIRSQLWGHNMRIIAVTAYQDHGHKSREAGFDGHMVKPADYQELSALITSLTAERWVTHAPCQ
jgi:CheY-like chemotaxis protein